jgi:hypothetical protein
VGSTGEDARHEAQWPEYCVAAKSLLMLTRGGLMVWGYGDPPMINLRADMTQLTINELDKCSR